MTVSIKGLSASCDVCSECVLHVTRHIITLLGSYV